ncbi:MAG: sigma 54-interacting transcriptional regulator, partial [Thermodesulfobacteriota bacterium]
MPEPSSLVAIDLLAVIDGVPHGIAILDSRQEVVAINRSLEALTGYSREEAGGLPVEPVLRCRWGADRPPVAAVLAEGAAITCEGDIIDRHRKRVPIRFVVAPLPGGDGEPQGVVVTLEDLSLLKGLQGGGPAAVALEGVIGHSPKMQAILELVPIVARTDASVLITGETGTGKDLVAEAIHRASPRGRHPFIKVNCGALPETLLESELFGHVRGAFTGAQTDKPGMFRLAHGGTIFLTEIGDLPLPLQVKLLTVLDDREFYPLGGSKKVAVDVRIMAGTHRDLRCLVREGRFREDLYFRLNVLRLHLPPLREREGDLRLLADHFVQRFSAGLRKRVRGLASAVYELLAGYPFPGNVR